MFPHFHLLGTTFNMINVVTDCFVLELWACDSFLMHYYWFLADHNLLKSIITRFGIHIGPMNWFNSHFIAMIYGILTTEIIFTRSTSVLFSVTNSTYYVCFELSLRFVLFVLNYLFLKLFVMQFYTIYYLFRDITEASVCNKKAYWHCFVCLFSGEGDAQAVAVVPQCYCCLFLWQSGSTGSHSQAVQHQTQATKHRQTIMARTVVSRLTKLFAYINDNSLLSQRNMQQAHC